MFQLAVADAARPCRTKATEHAVVLYIRVAATSLHACTGEACSGTRLSYTVLSMSMTQPGLVNWASAVLLNCWLQVPEMEQKQAIHASIVAFGQAFAQQ